MIIKEIVNKSSQERTLEMHSVTYHTFKFLYCQAGLAFSLNSLSERLDFNKRDIKAGLIMLESRNFIKHFHKDGIVYYEYNINIEEPIKFR